MFKNESMELLLLKQSGNDALFLNITSNELIKALGVTFKGNNVQWQQGIYKGDIANHLEVI